MKVQRESFWENLREHELSLSKPMITSFLESVQCITYKNFTSIIKIIKFNFIKLLFKCRSDDHWDAKWINSTPKKNKKELIVNIKYNMGSNNKEKLSINLIRSLIMISHSFKIFNILYCTVWYKSINFKKWLHIIGAMMYFWIHLLPI